MSKHQRLFLNLLSFIEYLCNSTPLLFLYQRVYPSFFPHVPLLFFHPYDEEEEREHGETSKEEVATKSDFFLGV